MEIHALVLVLLGHRLAVLRLRVTTVEEAASIGGPGGAAELDPLECLRQFLAGLHVADANLIPVTAAAAGAIGQPFAVVAEAGDGQGHGAILGQGIRVQQHLRLALQRVRPIKHALVLQARVPRVKPALALAERQAKALVVPQFLQPVADRLALGQRLQVAEGHLVLRLHPGLGFVGVVILQPAIRIRHLGAVVNIHHVVLTSGGVGQGLSESSRGHEQQDKCRAHNAAA